MGSRGMSEGAAMIGSTLTILSEPDAGTEAEIALHPADRDAHEVAPLVQYAASDTAG